MATATEIKAFRKLVGKHPAWPRALCFGDSWLQYPPHPTDLHKQLRRLFRHTALLNESRPGRESAEIKALMPRLRALLAEFRFDVLVVSMGGNDVVGNELAEYVKALKGSGEEITGFIVELVNVMGALDQANILGIFGRVELVIDTILQPGQPLLVVTASLQPGDDGVDPCIVGQHGGVQGLELLAQ